MYGCSLAATNAARQQGNSDTAPFLMNGGEGEARMELNAMDDMNCNADEDSGFKVNREKYFFIININVLHIQNASMGSLHYPFFINLKRFNRNLVYFHNADSGRCFSVASIRQLRKM